MNEQRLELLHKLLSEIASVKSAEELQRVMKQYSENPELSGEAWKTVLYDIKEIGGKLISLSSEKADDTRSKQLAALSEQERAELAEVEKIIDENLLNYHFQPIVNAIDGEIYSYEALMRPKSSLCPSPYHVIKYAELTERLNDIERATFLNVLGIIESDKNSFGGRRVFINSIPKTRLSEKDNARVCRLLEKHSDAVVVEMTEQAELEDGELGRTKELYRRMNIRIAVDDYGTGYSNVQNLLRYMPDYVKIDRSLLSEIHNNQKKRHFVREIIEFCHDNGIMALAEGVETAEELRTVILLGADLIQGYYTARPAAVIADSIPYEIRQEIKLYHQEREDGKALRIYTAESSERITLERLEKEKYECILIGKNGDGDVTVAGVPGRGTKLHIDVAKGFKGSIVLENAALSNVKQRPCIDIGENCEVRLVLIGTNQLRKGGIRVPESSRLVCCGDGQLSINIDGACQYAIGNDVDSAHGELVFEQGVFIESSSVTGVCIGSGLGGKISILRGQFILNITGVVGVGIGALYADTDLDLFACDITVDSSFQRGVAIGSLEGRCRAYIHNSSVKLYLSGVDIVGVGTLTGSDADVTISDANAVFNVVAANCSAAAAMTGSTDFKLARAGMHITAEGENALAIGGLNDNTKIQLVNSDTSVRLTTSLEYTNYIKTENVEVSGGRTRFIINDDEIQ